MRLQRWPLDSRRWALGNRKSRRAKPKFWEPQGAGTRQSRVVNRNRNTNLGQNQARTE